MNRLLKKGSSKMQVVYAGENSPNEIVKSIFLAGPTPRSNKVNSWRQEALRLLEELNYDGIVFVPEARTGEKYPNYDDQIDWETKMLNISDCIVFWINRQLRDDFEMIGLTTNIEFGKWLDSGKISFGFPPEAEKMKYLEYVAKENNVTIFNDLNETLNDAINKIGDGSYRVNGECEVPLYVWKTKSFQDWYAAQIGAGNELIHARVEYTSRVGPNKDIVFLWIVHVEVYITKEDRVKDIEFVVSRTSTSAILMHGPIGENALETEIVLVREFRSPATTKDGYIWELPGGSSSDDKEEMAQVAADEINEEVGLKISKERINYIQGRQLNGTLLANKTFLYKVELTPEELDWLKGEKGKVKGKIEDTERTYTEVVSLKNILGQELVDWSNVGMILSIITRELNGIE